MYSQIWFHLNNNRNDDDDNYQPVIMTVMSFRKYTMPTMIIRALGTVIKDFVKW